MLDLFQKYTIALILCLCMIISANAQKIASIKPVVNEEELALKKLLTIATNPADNGLKLVDTISPNNKYLVTTASTITFPGAIGTSILSRSTSYKGNVADIYYTWSSLIKKIPQSDSLSFNKRIGQLQEIISRIIPNVRDTFYIQKTYNNEMIWEWEVKKNHKLKLTALVQQKYNLPNEVKLQLTVNKSLKQDQKRITDSLFNSYSKLIQEAASRKNATSYFLSLLKVLAYEGLPQSEILNKTKPIFKTVANKDMGAASKIIIDAPEYAWKAFQGELSPEQLVTFKSNAKKVSDDFNAKYFPKQTETQGNGLSAAKPKKEDFNGYFSNDPYPKAGSKFVYVSYRDANGLYKIKEVSLKRKGGHVKKWFIESHGTEQVVDDSYFALSNTKWKAVHIGDCSVCYGTGTEVTRTPYTYYYEEKGIYNKYTYSGSGYNTTSKVCSLCQGEGFRISKLQL